MTTSMKKLLAIIGVQSLFLILTIVGWALSSNKTVVVQEKVDYERITQKMDVQLQMFANELYLLQVENAGLSNEIRNLKSDLPDYKKGMKQINYKLKSIEDAFTTKNYSDSTANALLDRLSR